MAVAATVVVIRVAVVAAVTLVVIRVTAAGALISLVANPQGELDPALAVELRGHIKALRIRVKQGKEFRGEGRNLPAGQNHDKESELRSAHARGLFRPKRWYSRPLPIVTSHRRSSCISLSA